MEYSAGAAIPDVSGDAGDDDSAVKLQQPLKLYDHIADVNGDEAKDRRVSISVVEGFKPPAAFPGPSTYFQKFPPLPMYYETTWSVVFAINFLILLIVPVVTAATQDRNATFKTLVQTSGGSIAITLLICPLFAMFAQYLFKRAYAHVSYFALCAFFPTAIMLIALVILVKSYVSVALLSIVFLFVLSRTVVLLCRESSGLSFTIEFMLYEVAFRRRFPRFVRVTLLGLFINVVLSTLFIVGMTATEILFLQGTTFLARLLQIILVLVFVWNTQVVKTCQVLIASRVFAEYYFSYSGSTQASDLSFSNIFRVIRISRGSIVLGALITVLVQAFRFVYTELSAWPILRFLGNLLKHYFSGISPLVDVYAFVYVSILHVSYCTAAQLKLDLFSARGFEIIVSEEHSSFVMSIISFIGASLVTLLVFLESFLKLNLTSAILVTSCFVASFQMFRSTFGVFEGAFASLLVCYAEDPAMLYKSDQTMYYLVTTKFLQFFRNRVSMFTSKS